MKNRAKIVQKNSKQLFIVLFKYECAGLMSMKLNRCGLKYTLNCCQNMQDTVIQ